MAGAAVAPNVETTTRNVETTMQKFFRWSKDAIGTTPQPEGGALCILRSGSRHLRWSVCVVRTTTGRQTLENVADVRTIRDAKRFIEQATTTR